VPTCLGSALVAISLRHKTPLCNPYLCTDVSFGVTNCCVNTSGASQYTSDCAQIPYSLRNKRQFFLFCKLKNWEVALSLRTKLKKKEFCVGIVLKIGDCEEGRGPSCLEGCVMFGQVCYVAVWSLCIIVCKLYLLVLSILVRCKFVRWLSV